MKEAGTDDFIDDVLVGFFEGGRMPLKQILSGG